MRVRERRGVCGVRIYRVNHLGRKPKVGGSPARESSVMQEMVL